MSSLITAANCFVPRNKEEEESVEKSYGRYREMMANLPREKGWLTEHIFQYKGFWFHPQYGLEGTLWLQENYKTRSDDVLLVTAPKSGTIWLKALIFSVMNRNRYDISQHPLLTTNPHECVPFLELKLFRISPIGDPEILPSPRLLATHTPFTLLPESVIASGCKIVYVCRNPKDVFVSLWHFMAKLRQPGLPVLPVEDAFELFCNGVSPFGPFWDHVLGYWKASLEFPDRILFLKYEDMKKSSFDYVKKLAGFLGESFTEKEVESGVVQQILELCSFEKMSSLEVNRSGDFREGLKNDVFFRQGKVGDWKNHLTPQMIDRLDQITQQKLGYFGFAF